MTKQWVLDVKETLEGDPFIELNEEILLAANLKEGDTIKWVDNLDGSFSIIKADTGNYVLTDEYHNPELNRKAMVYVSKDKSEHIIDMFEMDTLVNCRRLVDKRYSYAEDCAENWVFAYGEFKK